MKEKLTIGEFAKLKNITTETLRHYDRIGLLKPVGIDENNRYRYYSIMQYEKLSTILELRQLGIELKQIKSYFDNRNMKKSLELLNEHYTSVDMKIKQLEKIKNSMGRKINHLEKFLNEKNQEQVIFKNLPERKCIVWHKEIDNELEIGYCCMELENSLEEIAPIIAENRYGIITDYNFLKNNKEKLKYSLAIFVEDDIQKKYTKIINKGSYASYFVYGELEKCLAKAKSFSLDLAKQGYKTIGDVIQIMQVDISVTDIENELLFEIQIPVSET